MQSEPSEVIVLQPARVPDLTTRYVAIRPARVGER